MSSIKKNFGYQAIYEILIIILPFFTSPYIARVLGAKYIGIYAYTYSIACYFQMFCSLGMKFYGNRSVAKVRNDKNALNKLFCELFSTQLAFSLISLSIYVLYSMFLSEYPYFSLLQGLLVLASLLDISWLFLGMEQFKTTVTRSAVVKLFSVICIFLFVKKPEDFPIYIIIIASSHLINSLVLLVLSNKYVQFKWEADFRLLSKHIKPLFVLFIPILALSLFKHMDKIMLGFIGDKVELGYYENAEKVLNIPLSIVFSFGSVMLPRMSSLAVNDTQKTMDRYMKLSIKYVLGFSFAMAAGLAAVSSVFAPIFWGNEFVKSSLLILLLSLSIPFTTLANIIRNQDLIPNNRDMSYNISIILGAIVNLILNYFLIPKYQAFGVTIATIVAEFTVCVTEMWFVRSNKKYWSYMARSLIFLPQSVIMFFIVFSLGGYLGNHIYTLFIQIIVGIFSFSLMTLLLMFLCKDEGLDILKDLLKKTRVNRG